jgi:MFS family permease
VQISADLGLSAAQVGGLVTVFFTASALSSTTAGRATERLGPYRGLAPPPPARRSRCSASGCSPRVVLFAAALAVAGIGNAIGHPASNLLLARGVPRHRQGLAFGLKQGAIPLASLLAGLAVPRWG